MKIPLRLRLAVASCAAFVVVIAALEAIAYVSVGAAIHSIVDHELETRLAGMDDHLARHIPHYTWPQLRETLRAHPAFAPELLRIEGGGGEILFEGRGLAGISLPRPSGGVAIGTTGGVSRALRVLTVRRTIDGRAYGLTLATDLHFSARILGRLWLLMVLTLPLVLLIAGGAGYWISGHALAPVSGIIAAARSMDSTRLSERIAVPGTGDEIQQLAETMNAMLERIEDGFQRMRQFTASASHELRTPLAIIRANAEVALLDETDRSGRSMREALRRILKEAERDSALLENMLDLARAEAAAATDGLGRKPVELRGSLAAACADIRPLAEERGLDLRIAATCDATIEGDAEQLRRLWLILLDNAVKYTPGGGVITAAAGINAEARPWVAVSDTGIGIETRDCARIFEPFYRVDKARSRGTFVTREQSGAGLGLAIARHIAMAHGAALEVKSEPGAGSRFGVTFPR